MRPEPEALPVGQELEEEVVEEDCRSHAMQAVDTATEPFQQDNRVVVMVDRSKQEEDRSRGSGMRRCLLSLRR